LTLLGKELAIEFQMPLVLVSIPMSLVIMSVSRVMFPYLANNRDEAKMKSTILNSQYIFFILGLPICSLMIYFSQEISNIIFNPEWKNVSLALKLLSLNIFFNILQNPLSQLCLIKNKPKIGFYYAIIHLIARLTGLYLGYSLWGFTGSVALFVAFDSLVRVARLLIDIKLISITIKQYLLNIKIPITASLFVLIFFTIFSYLEWNKILIYTAIMLFNFTLILLLDRDRIKLLFDMLKRGMTNER
jgi:O-antigen/teichoic acid export membrane protein